ncbi:MAG: hypothetical protein ACI3Y0_01345 [Prevotella sp.]
MQKVLITLIIVLAMPAIVRAQENNDSIAFDFRSFVAKNFSRYRTMNFSYETKTSHDYTLSYGGEEMEKGRRKNLHTIRFSTMIPLIKMKKVSFYANCSYACYNFGDEYNQDSQVFHEKSYNYYYGGFNGSYYARLFNRPLILSAEVAVDGWDKGWGKLQGRASAIMVLKNGERTKSSAGLMGMTLFSSTPVIPIIGYWHRFANPNWSVDITLPSQMYLRYQMKYQRISIGATISADKFYVDSTFASSPSVCFYQEAVMKPEIHYEYIINRHLYLSAHAGISMILKSGLYTKNRKEVETVSASGTTVKGPIV